MVCTMLQQRALKVSYWNENGMVRTMPRDWDIESELLEGECNGAHHAMRMGIGSELLERQWQGTQHAMRMGQ